MELGISTDEGQQSQQHDDGRPPEAQAPALAQSQQQPPPALLNSLQTERSDLLPTNDYIHPARIQTTPPQQSVGMMEEEEEEVVLGSLNCDPPENVLNTNRQQQQQQLLLNRSQQMDDDDEKLREDRTRYLSSSSTSSATSSTSTSSSIKQSIYNNSSTNNFITDNISGNQTQIAPTIPNETTSIHHHHHHLHHHHHHHSIGSNPPPATTFNLCGQNISNSNSANSSSSSNNNIRDKNINSNNYQPIINYRSNDAKLIQNRRINFNSKARKCFELMCEDKVSKDSKLEEVHFSSPSSFRSTFIMTFSPDGQKVASTHNDHRIYICDLSTGKLLDTLEGHPKTPWCLAWHPNNKEILASGCLAGEVRVWDLRSKNCETWTSENNTIIASLDFHPKERILVIATSNDIHFWDWSEPEPFAKTTTIHDKEKVKFVEFDSSGTKLITGISNLPKYTSTNTNNSISSGFMGVGSGSSSGDSLQNRIIDGYLNHGTLDQLPSVAATTTDNMTQTSETTSNSNYHRNNNNSGDNSSNETHANFQNLQQANRNHNQPQSPLIFGTNTSNTTNEQDLTYRSTLTLSRIASLYRQLEALEDSMRHTSFSPYISPRPLNSPIESNIDVNTPESREAPSDISDRDATINIDNQPSTIPPNQLNNNSPSITLTEPAMTAEPAPSGTSLPPDPTVPSESFVVSFDESLEQLQLAPMIVDGRTINLSNVVERYPIDFPWQLHYMMQFESISQVNQNFIRISKLMSSVRLYRQIVQQILSGDSNQEHFQPNHILTAQSVRSGRNSSSMPVVFQNPFPIVTPMVDLSHRSTTSSRTSDPIMAIQFRNSARNVPLTTLCKIALLSARTICILRSQQLIESAITSFRFSDNQSSSATNDVVMTTSNNPDEQSNNESSTSNEFGQSQDQDSTFYSPLNQLYGTLLTVNHAPLTTSNVFINLTSLRKRINKLLDKLMISFQTQAEGRRLVDLIHNVAHSLTGRSWNMFLGGTLNDIRLDVVHTLCVFDLTLHLVRQVQFLQMQRLSAMVRVEESRRLAARTNNNNNEEYSNRLNSNASATTTTTTTTTTTSDGYSGSQTTISPERFYGSTSKAGQSTISSKRKDSTVSSDATPSDTSTKKIKLESNADNASDQTNNQPLTSKPEMIETNAKNIGHAHSNSSIDASPNQISNDQQRTINTNLQNISQSSDRSVVWNSPNTRQTSESLQRFLVATASSMSNSHILVRIYSRFNGNTTSNIPANIIEQNLEGSLSNAALNPVYESRRRSLSQDNNILPPIGPQESILGSSTNTLGSDLNSHHQGRFRQIHVYPANGPSSLGFASFDRHPHLHVYQSRGQHLWFNQWTIPVPVSNSNYRLQCWNFSSSTIPNIKDPQANLVTQKCRIHNSSSIDISNNGFLLACLVPRDDSTCIPNFDMKIFSLRAYDFGTCYYKLRQGASAISVSLSPSASHVVVGMATNKFISNDQNEDELSIARIYKLTSDLAVYVRDIKIKKDSSSSLNAIRWMPRGIVYNVGPQHHQRYQAGRMRGRF